MYNNTNLNNERGTRNPATGAGTQQAFTYGQSAASGPAPNTAGPHKHDIMNKLDPRVDSTADKHDMSQTGGRIPEGTYGPHSSRVANALDPRVDSDLDSTRATGTAGVGAGTHGTGVHGAGAHHTGVGVGGTTTTTAGPHKSNLLNKLDPAVDSKTGAYTGSSVTGTGTGAGAGAGVPRHGAPGGTGYY